MPKRLSALILLLAAMPARMAAQRSGEVTYHDGAEINKYSISLTNDGIIASAPVADLVGEQAMVWAAISATKVRPSSSAFSDEGKLRHMHILAHMPCCFPCQCSSEAHAVIHTFSEYLLDPKLYTHQRMNAQRNCLSVGYGAGCCGVIRMHAW
jgi:hypothetical protein